MKEGHNSLKRKKKEYVLNSNDDSLARNKNNLELSMYAL